MDEMLSRYRLFLDATPALGAKGGIPRYVSELLRSLQAAVGGAVARGWAAVWRSRRARAAAFGRGAIAGPRLPQPLLRGLWTTDLAALAPRCDLFHATTPVCPPRGRAALVVTVHDLAPFDGPGWFAPGPRRAFQAWLRRAVERADALVVPSAFSRARLERHFPGSHGRVHVVPHGLDHAWPAGRPPGPLRDARGRVRPLPEGFLLVVGTVQPRKGLRRLFAAMERSERSLLVAGRPGWLCGPIHRAAAASPAAGRLLFAPALDDGQLAWLFERAAVVVQASPYEGFGFPPLEAARRGTPVCAVPGTPLDDWLGADYGRLEGGPGAWAERFEEAACGRGQGRGEEVRRRLAALTWGSCARRHLEVYETALQAASRRLLSAGISS